MSQHTPIAEIGTIVKKAHEAYLAFKCIDLKRRAAFMHQVADEIEALGPELITTAQSETNLPEARLSGEKARTVLQWRSYADAIDQVLCIRIDTADANRTPPKPDLRKTYIGLGVVTVFGASNFPFAFSTAGGDTASAIAAGCAVIMKAHSGHPKTSGVMTEAIERAIKKTNMPRGLFAEVHTSGVEGGQYLASHPLIKAIGFTGSFAGGKALFDAAARRQTPIPVFAEMGSVNPVFVLSRKLESNTEDIAKQYLASLTLGVGQFCTNPGIIIVPNSPALPLFLQTLSTQAKEVQPSAMLHPGIADAYHRNKTQLLQCDGVSTLAKVNEQTPETHGNTVIAKTSASMFLKNQNLSTEVFGPFGLVVTYDNDEEMYAIAQSLEGQLTTTVLGNPDELTKHTSLVNILTEKCGRLLFSGFPTGVEVCYAMQHGGPFPAATDSRFTSVGPDAILRFARPLSYQNCPDGLLPPELKNNNPLRVWRTVNGQTTNRGL